VAAVITSIARMNITAMEDDALHALRAFFARLREAGTEHGKSLAGSYLQVIDEEISKRAEVAP